MRENVKSEFYCVHSKQNQKINFTVRGLWNAFVFLKVLMTSDKRNFSYKIPLKVCAGRNHPPMVTNLFVAVQINLLPFSYYFILLLWVFMYFEGFNSKIEFSKSGKCTQQITIDINDYIKFRESGTTSQVKIFLKARCL